MIPSLSLQAKKGGKYPFFFLLISFLLSPLLAFPKPFIQAKSYVLMEAETGTVLLGHHMHTRRDIASITKVMTAILALEKAPLNQEVYVSQEAQNRKGDESTAWLKAGERLSIEDLLYALLLRSANDAAVVLAETVAGSEKAFVKMMNEKAQSLGLFNTHFGNSHGYYGINHYSSAFDVAEMARYAITHFPLFNHIIKTREYLIPWEGSPYDRVMRNHNKLLQRYPYADGIKTGWTKRAGKCLAASATKNGMRLIAVVLNSPDIYSDAIALFEYGFTRFQKKVLIPQNTVVQEEKLFFAQPATLRYRTKEALVYVGEQEAPSHFSLALQKRKIALPVFKGEPLGTLSVYWEGRLQRQIPLVADENHFRDYKALLFPATFLILPASFFLRRRKKRLQRRVLVRKLSC